MQKQLALFGHINDTLAAVEDVATAIAPVCPDNCLRGGCKDCESPDAYYSTTHDCRLCIKCAQKRANAVIKQMKPAERKEICEHSDRCESPLNCSDLCKNRPDRPPIKAG